MASEFFMILLHPFILLNSTMSPEVFSPVAFLEMKTNVLLSGGSCG